MALPDDDRRELIDGELVETEMPTELHEYIVARLCALLTLWSDEHGGHALASGYKVRITAKQGFMPDVQFFRRGNKADRRPTGLERGHPDLAVEIISPGRGNFDRNIKLLGYASIGVPEYWIVDPDARVLERLVLRRGRYVVEDVAGEGETLKPSSFPGLSIPCDKLFSMPPPARR